MKQAFLSLLLIFFSLAAPLSAVGADKAKPRVWWHWMNGNISKDGIRKDLLWMKQAGIGGFTVFDAGMQTPQVAPHRLGYMTPEWKDALYYSLALADSLGLEVTIPSSPGVEPHGRAVGHAPTTLRKKLTWRTLSVTGNGRRQDITLPKGFDTTGPYLNKRIEPNVLLGEVIPDDLPRQYRDICVLAVPLKSYELRVTSYRAAGGELSQAALTDICHRHGLAGRYTESHEHGRLYIADGMAVKRTAAVPMAAIWARQADGKPCHDTTAAADIRESASVANIYGQNVVATESFTCVGYPNNAWTFSPETLKPYADFAFANGVNSIVVHTSPHQPVDSLRPGLSLSAVGQWFDRHETWADLANVWTGYLERTSRLLQSGHAVKDILYYYGEDNNISALFSHCPPQLPTGYGFDYANADVLLNRVVAQGSRLVTSTGMSYAALFIDPTVRRMSLPVLRRVVELAKAGVPVYGAAPTLPLSLSDDENVWRQLAAELSGSLCIKHSALSIAPDALLSSTAAEQPTFVHRQDGPRHIYWLSNPADTVATVTASLRETAPHAWLYDAERGDTLAGWKPALQSDRTLVTLAMQPHGAVFVMLDDGQRVSDVTGGVGIPAYDDSGERRQECLRPQSPAARPSHRLPLRSWHLSIPQLELTLDSLTPLNESQDPALRYFSGTATYRTTVKLSKREAKSGCYTLDLGEVKNIAASVSTATPPTRCGTRHSPSTSRPSCAVARTP